MTQDQVNQLLLIGASNLPSESLDIVRENLENMEYNDAMILFSQMKDPTIALVLSIVVGAYGVDRFYLGQVGMGLGKLFTLGGCLIWWIIDMIQIMGITRKKNLEMLLGHVA